MGGPQETDPVVKIDANTSLHTRIQGRTSETEALYQAVIDGMANGSGMDMSNGTVVADNMKLQNSPVTTGVLTRRDGLRMGYIFDAGTGPITDSDPVLLDKVTVTAQKSRSDAIAQAAITDELNRNSVIRETRTPILEPLLVELPNAAWNVVDGVGDAAKAGTLGLFNLTIAPIADVMQAGIKALHGAVTGDVQPLTPLSSFGEDVVNRGAGTEEGLREAARNVFDVSPVGMIYHAGTGGYDVTRAIQRGDVRAATTAGIGLGMNFAGAKAAGFDRYGIRAVDIGASGPLRFQRGSVGVEFFGPERPNLDPISSRVAGENGAGPRYKTWNQFQTGTVQQFANRAEAAKAWEIYKDANGIVGSPNRSQAERAKFLKQLADNDRTPRWMNQWLKKGKVPPGYEVDHIKPLSVGGPDKPFNMRLLDGDLHDIHHRYYRPWQWE
jgi:hypothetical protein